MELFKASKQMSQNFLEDKDMFIIISGKRKLTKFGRRKLELIYGKKLTDKEVKEILINDSLQIQRHEIIAMNQKILIDNYIYLRQDLLSIKKHFEEKELEQNVFYCDMQKQYLIIGNIMRDIIEFTDDLIADKNNQK